MSVRGVAPGSEALNAHEWGCPEGSEAAELHGHEVMVTVNLDILGICCSPVQEE